MLSEMIHKSYRYFNYITSPITLNFSSSTQQFSSLFKSFWTGNKKNCPPIIFHIPPPPEGPEVCIPPATCLSTPCPPFCGQCLLFDPSESATGHVQSLPTSILRPSSPRCFSEMETRHFLKAAGSCLYPLAVSSSVRSRDPLRTVQREGHMGLGQALGNVWHRVGIRGWELLREGIPGSSLTHLSTFHLVCTPSALPDSPRGRLEELVSSEAQLEKYHSTRWRTYRASSPPLTPPS